MNAKIAKIFLTLILVIVSTTVFASPLLNGSPVGFMLYYKASKTPSVSMSNWYATVDSGKVGGIVRGNIPVGPVAFSATQYKSYYFKTTGIGPNKSTGTFTVGWTINMVGQPPKNIQLVVKVIDGKIQDQNCKWHTVAIDGGYYCTFAIVPDQSTGLSTIVMVVG